MSIVDRDASSGGHTAALLWGHGNATTTDSRALVSQYCDGDTRDIKVLGERFEQDKWTSNGQDKWTSTILSLGNCHCVDGHWTSVLEVEVSPSSWSHFQLEVTFLQVEWWKSYLILLCMSKYYYFFKTSLKLFLIFTFPFELLWAIVIWLHLGGWQQNFLFLFLCIFQKNLLC